MERIRQKIATLQEAATTLLDAIKLFYTYKLIFETTESSVNRELYKATRDSMIQRFEYNVDLVWKTIKIYLEDKERLTIAINSPRGIIREAVKAKIFSEKEGDDLMEMIEWRNKTSHIYHQPMAEDVANHIPYCSNLIEIVINRLCTLLNT